MAAAVNAWAAAGYKLDRPDEVEAARALRERNLDALRRMWGLETAAGPTLPALQRQAYAMELVERLAGVDGRGRARRCLARRCLCGTAALLFSVLTLVGAGFLVWDTAIKVRSRAPTHLSIRNRAPALIRPRSCPITPPTPTPPHPTHTHTLILPTPCLIHTHLPLHPHRRTPCGPRSCLCGPFFAAASAPRLSPAGSSSRRPTSRRLEAHSCAPQP